VRIQFYFTKLVEQEDGSLKLEYKFVPAVRCTEKYADWIAANPDDEVSRRILSDESYVCPLTDVIELLRNPDLETTLPGSNFGLVINDCEVAKNAVSDQIWLDSYAS